MLESKVFAAHRTLVQVYQTAHWLSKGSTFYSDHLLYERLYNEASAIIDGMAEKFISVAGEYCINPVVVSKKVCDMLESYQQESSPEALLENACGFQLAALKITKEYYLVMQQEEKLTLGLDDFLMALCNDHEHRLYLLEQRKKG